MNKYRKKPIEIEAIQYDGTEKSFEELSKFTDYKIQSIEGTILEIPTLEGNMKVNEGDWIIKGVEGEFYPCKDSIFKSTYEKVESDE